MLPSLNWQCRVRPWKSPLGSAGQQWIWWRLMGLQYLDAKRVDPSPSSLPGTEEDTLLDSWDQPQDTPEDVRLGKDSVSRQLSKDSR